MTLRIGRIFFFLLLTLSGLRAELDVLLRTASNLSLGSHCDGFDDSLVVGEMCTGFVKLQT